MQELFCFSIDTLLHFYRIIESFHNQFKCEPLFKKHIKCYVTFKVLSGVFHTYMNRNKNDLCWACIVIVFPSFVEILIYIHIK